METSTKLPEFLYYLSLFFITCPKWEVIMIVFSMSRCPKHLSFYCVQSLLHK